MQLSDADICSQVTGALLAQRYGGKVVLGRAGLAWSLLTCLTPPAASLGLPPLIACRVLLGVAEGFLIPVNSHIVGSWVPAEERGRAVSAVIAGCNLGTVVAFLLSPLIMVSLGWPYCFYIFGSTGVAWYAAWQVYAEDAVSDETSLSVCEESILDQVFHLQTQLSSKSICRDERTFGLRFEITQLWMLYSSTPRQPQRSECLVQKQCGRLQYAIGVVGWGTISALRGFRPTSAQCGVYRERSSVLPFSRIYRL